LNVPIQVYGVQYGRLDILISRSDIVAEGTVVDRAGQPVPGAEVVLVPPQGFARRSREDRYLNSTADAVGNFRITGVPPGTYTAFAFEEIEPGAYFVFASDSRLLNNYAPKGQVLDMEQAGRPQLRLTAVPASETSGGIR
jgi:hypothetical protein